MDGCLNACTVPISDEVQIGGWMDFRGWRVVGLFLYYVENCIFWFSFAIKIRRKENERKKDFFKTIWAILFIKLLTLWCFLLLLLAATCKISHATQPSKETDRHAADRQTNGRMDGGTGTKKRRCAMLVGLSLFKSLAKHVNWYTERKIVYISYYL